MSIQNSLSPEDFATPEQIARNVERIAKIGDRGETPDMFAEHWVEVGRSGVGWPSASQPRRA